MIEKINQYYKKPIFSIIEIGSAHGKDADYLAKTFNVDSNNVHIFEPRPDACALIKSQYPQYKIYEIAVSNFSNSKVKFNVDCQSGEMSSLLYRERNRDLYDYGHTLYVNVDKFKNICDKNNINSIDLVKIDTEGCTYEVLCGFEEIINKVKVFHLECENIEFWKDQRFTKDVLGLLKDFQLVFTTNNEQDDLILINKKFL